MIAIVKSDFKKCCIFCCLGKRAILPIGGFWFFVCFLCTRILGKCYWCTFQKPGSTTADKSFAIGTIGETLHAMEDASAMFAENLYPHFLKMTQDEDEEVRSNAVFGLGILARYGGPVIHRYP